MSVHSAGILLYRFVQGRLQVMLVHPGGPLWTGRDAGAWSIPKGLSEQNEALFDAARREFSEETGFGIDGVFTALGEIRQASGKIVHAWAVEGDLDAGRVRSNTFTLEWPRHSGKLREYPEVDKAQWFDIDAAGIKIAKGQAGFLQRLRMQLKDVN